MPYIGELSALFTALLWSGTAFAFSAAAARVGPLQLNINRMILAVVFLSLTIIIFNFPLYLTTDQLIFLSLSGIVGLVFGDSFLFKAYQTIGPRLGMLLMSLAPAMAAIMAYFFLGENLSFWGIIGMLVTIFGIAVVVLERNNAAANYKFDKMGIFYGALGALGQAAGLIFAKIAFDQGDVNKMTATFIRIISSVVIMLPAALIIRKYKNPFKLYRKDKKALISTTLGTILGPYLGITFSLIAIAHAKVGIAATLMATVPIIMLPMARYIYKEKLSPRAIIGAVIAVIGVAILFLR